MLLTITHFKKADLEAACAITVDALRSMGYLSQAEISDISAHALQNYQNCAELDSEHLFLKSVENNEITGVILVKNFWNLAELYVLEKMQKAGVGKGLLAEAIKVCSIKSPRGHVRVNSSINAENFYRKFGFTDFISEHAPPYGCIPLIFDFSYRPKAPNMALHSGTLSAGELGR